MNNQSNHVMKKVSALTLSALFLIAPIVGQTNEMTTSLPIQQSSQAQQVVSLNHSSLEQLVTLKGIGQTKAQAILVYRKEVGGFKSINELTKISGIGEKIVNENKMRLSL